jgi:hypothetical protein
MKGGSFKWVLLGVAVFIVAIFVFGVTAVLTYQLFIAPETTR